MNKRKVLLRFDDLCPTMNWEQWERAKSMLDRTGTKALLGVVPNCQDPYLEIEVPRTDFWLYIKKLQAQGHSVAMHGYNHCFELKTDGIVTRNKISEFAGLPYEKQLEKIREGKQVLNSYGIETTIFFAPAHSFDDNTLKALSVCGFKYVSDGYSCKPYYRKGIKLLPCRSGGVPKLRKNDGYLTAVVHTNEWTKKENEFEFLRFRDLIENHASDIIDFKAFSEWEAGVPFFQRVYEKLYLYARTFIAPLLIKLIRLKKKNNN